jgi:hypothetical protein
MAADSTVKIRLTSTHPDSGYVVIEAEGKTLLQALGNLDAQDAYQLDLLQGDAYHRLCFSSPEDNFILEVVKP